MLIEIDGKKLQISDGQRKIIDAFFQIAVEQPKLEKITFQLLADRSGMVRETIHRSYFANQKELFDKIHCLLDYEIRAEAEKFIKGKDLDFFKFVSASILPLLYEKKIGSRFFMEQL